MTTTASPSRHVLGEKSTNASLNLHDLKTKGELQVLAACKKPQIESSPRTGTKRRFHEVEPSSQQRGQVHSGWHDAARARVGLTKGDMEEVDTEPSSLVSSFEMPNAATASSASLDASTNTAGTSFHASQEPSQQPIEERFEIVQEESQHTLEQIHATPMPDPQLSHIPPERPSLLTEFSEDSVRMSSFIDFDEADETQRGKLDEDLEMFTPPRPESAREEELKTNQLLEKAAMLRTRLQLAMHKVDTNQTSRPFSRLDKPKPFSPVLSLPPRTFTANILPADRPANDTAFRNSPESQIAANRARVFRGEHHTKPVQFLNSLPVPKIIPTAFSARYVDQARTQLNYQEPSTVHRARFPKSPGFREGVLKGMRTNATPSPFKGTGKRRLPKTPMHELSSSPSSQDGNSARGIRRAHGESRSALTSSVVKGEAANGLLELMRAASR